MSGRQKLVQLPDLSKPPELKHMLYPPISFPHFVFSYAACRPDWCERLRLSEQS